MLPLPGDQALDALVERIELATDASGRGALARELAELARHARGRAEDAEACLRARDERALVLDALAGRLAEAVDADQVARVVTDATREMVGADVVVLALAGREAGRLALVDDRHLEPEIAARYRSFPTDAALPSAVAHREGRPIFFDDLDDLTRSHPELVEAAAALGRGAGASLPLLIGERSLGSLAFAFGRPHKLPEPTRELLAAIARQAAVALERVELLARAQRETARIRYLAHAGMMLASTTNPRETLATLARLAVPELADWAAIDLFVEGPSTDRVAVAHTDPAKVALVEEIARRYPPRLDDEDDGLGQILRTGEPLFVPELTPEMLAVGLRDDEHLRMVRSLGLRSYLCVPIVSRDRVRGALSLIAAESGRRYGEDDLQLALEIARRASIALDAADVLDDVRAAEQLARRSDEQKNEFLAMLGHELRNPLAAIATAGELLKLRGDGSDPVVERARSAITRQAEHMKRMLDDLLDVARIVRRKLQMEHELLDISELVRLTVDDHRAEAAARGVTVGLELPSSPVTVRGDRTRLVQMVANLVLNAAQFTGQGGRVDLRLRPADDEVVIEVADTGIGIDPAKLSELFDPFSQARRAVDRSRSGLGLGLALVKGLVDLHGGSVAAWSEGEGRGATFTVRLPLAAEQAGQGRRDSSDVGGPLRVLLVEDDPDGGEMLLMLIEAFGHVAWLAQDGAQAVELAGRERPDMVLCDIGLPGDIDGFEVARLLRANRDLGDPMLVALSGFGLPEHMRKAERSGFHRFLTKPITREGLLQILEEAAHRRAAR